MTPCRVPVCSRTLSRRSAASWSFIAAALRMSLLRGHPTLVVGGGCVGSRRLGRGGVGVRSSALALPYQDPGNVAEWVRRTTGNNYRTEPENRSLPGAKAQLT